MVLAWDRCRLYCRALSFNSSFLKLHGGVQRRAASPKVWWYQHTPETREELWEREKDVLLRLDDLPDLPVWRWVSSDGQDCKGFGNLLQHRGHVGRCWSRRERCVKMNDVFLNDYGSSSSWAIKKLIFILPIIIVTLKVRVCPIVLSNL